MTQPIPEGYNHPIPSLTLDGAAAAIEFYENAFGARVRARMDGPGGIIAHAELEVGDSVLMLADAFPQSSNRPPGELGGTPVSVFLYVDDVDAVFQRAVDAGATVIMAPEDMFWGDRWSKLTDPFGHQWELATHTEDVPPDELERRGREMMAGLGLSPVMDLDEAREFIRHNHRGVLATRRGDGGIQQSPVIAAVDGGGRVVISSRETAYKVRNLRRDPWAQLCVFTDRFFGPWQFVEGAAEVVSLPEAMDLLIDYYQRFPGENPDWDEYRERMESERRVLVRIEVERAGPDRQG